jgi:type II secretory pathway component PulL
VLHLGVRGYDLVRLHSEQQRLDAAIEQAARIALPDVERIEDARAQVEQRLSGAGNADPNGLLTQLAAVAGALAAAPGPKLESLGWRERSLELQLVAPTTDSIARFAQGINQRGLSADVASTTNSEKGVEAQVRIAAGTHK